jgi:hypothetical protein
VVSRLYRRAIEVGRKMSEWASNEVPRLDIDRGDTPEPLFKIGQRAMANEGGEELVKVVNLRWDENTAEWEYQVRAFNHPHNIYWVDKYHIGYIQGRWHDERYY